MKVPLVLVIWEDITSSAIGWVTREEIGKAKTAICYSPGWILEESEDNYYLVSAYSTHEDQESFSFDTVIPKKVVKKIILLRKNWKHK